ncbi:helix-turn-helix domain-containing protein [Falsirhodobacter sp. alg1]|uniref:helix-turn-helix domain-containing protein n=1 Tax=Falsirhodobacter sp. alg1 TaxID=1472418 RepID=UPI0006937AFF|nr:helix-turn-helix transcriptional regulator [Falsirhodobacter sp. alg1]
MDHHDTPAILKATGDRVRAARTAAQLNLAQLARLTGISQAALSLIETGKRDPRLTTLHRIATALRVPLASFVAHDGTTANAPSTGRGHDLTDFLE